MTAGVSQTHTPPNLAWPGCSAEAKASVVRQFGLGAAHHGRISKVGRSHARAMCLSKRPGQPPLKDARRDMLAVWRADNGRLFRADNRRGAIPPGPGRFSVVKFNRLPVIHISAESGFDRFDVGRKGVVCKLNTVVQTRV